jgi:hypothetical protein
MPGGILQALLSAISGIFGAINNVFGAKNTKEMKDRQLQQKETDHENEIEKAVKEKNVKKIRDSLAE